MSKMDTAAAVAASVKKSNADAAAMGPPEHTTAMGSPEFIAAMNIAGVRIFGGGIPPAQRGRGSQYARELVAMNLGKKRHRRGWCAL